VTPTGVTTAKIENLAVTTGKIDDLAVTTGKIDDLAVTTGKIDDLAVTVDKIGGGAVSAAKLASDAVTNAAIVDGTLSLTKLDTDVTTELELTDFKTALLATGPITPANPALVDFERIASVPADIKNKKASDLDCAPGVTPCVQDSEIQSVSGSKVSGAVASATTATNALDLACTGCVSATDLGADAVVGRALGGNEILQGSIAGEGGVGTAGATGDIARGTITGEALDATAAIVGNLALATVGSDNLADGAVSASKLGSDVEARLVAIEGDITDLQTRTDTLEQNFLDLADSAKSTPAVSSKHLTGYTVATATAAASVPPAIPAGGVGEMLLTVTGITENDLFTANTSPTTPLPNGVFVTGVDVDAAGTIVHVRLFNSTAAPVSPVNIDWKVRWMDLG
jgi:hypothetical protein